MPNYEEISYGAFGRCAKLTNGLIELYVTLDVGPRVIRLGIPGGRNMLAELPPATSDVTQWNIYGGHRLWYAPEDRTRSYLPDNTPVQIMSASQTVRFIQPVEAATGILKQIDITLDEKQPRAILTHRIINKGVWPVQLAPWALSVMAPGGRAIVPLPQRGSHSDNLLPTNTLTLWAYSNLSDPRWKFGYKYIYLQQDPTSDHNSPQKFGISHTDWLAYQNGDQVFVKTTKLVKGGVYPDMGCTAEIFTNDEMLEVETLAPLTTLEVGAVAEHTEQWGLYQGIPTVNNDADVDAHILPLVQ